MSSGTDKRKRAMAMRAAKLRRDGFTTREIADAIEKKPEQIKQIVLRGERLLSEQEEETK